MGSEFSILRDFPSPQFSDSVNDLKSQCTSHKQRDRLSIKNNHVMVRGARKEEILRPDLVDISLFQQPEDFLKQKKSNKEGSVNITSHREEERHSLLSLKQLSPLNLEDSCDRTSKEQ